VSDRTAASYVTFTRARERNREVALEKQAGDVVIRVLSNGPYRVEGPVRIVDADGREFDISAKRRISLCRCGGSTTKPFCDGTHSRIGFQAAERAVAESDSGTAD
jgi:CDGSH-type Zn-finger protein